MTEPNYPDIMATMMNSYNERVSMLEYERAQLIVANKALKQELISYQEEHSPKDSSLSNFNNMLQDNESDLIVE